MKALRCECEECGISNIIYLKESLSKSFIELYNKHKNHSLIINLIDTEKYVDLRSCIEFMINSDDFKHPLTGVEIGVWKGKNANCLMAYLDIEKLYLIDPYEFYDGYDESDYIDEHINPDETYINTKELLSPYKEKTKFIREKSEDAVKKIPDKLDFVYVDGNHSYEYVMKDIELYWPKIRKGGLLCGDDFGLHQPGVCRAVSEFIQENNLDNKLRRCRSMFEDWWIIK